MSSGERPIGTAKGKQPNAEALCQTPPPPCIVFLDDCSTVHFCLWYRISDRA